MDWLTIEGVPPWDGRYEFDIDGRELTTREWGWLKRLAGYMPLTIEDGFNGADPELFAVFAVIALHRAGRVQTGEVPETYERFADAPFGMTVRLESDEPADGREPDADPFANSPANGNDSGRGSPPSSEISDASPSPSGMPDWVTTASGRTISGS